jgi:nitrous oxidase accessory protein
MRRVAASASIAAFRPTLPVPRLPLLLFALLVTPGHAASLQQQIDDAPRGAIVLLPPGVHAGPLVIDKPLTLDGAGRATVDGGGRGTVITLRGSGVTLRGLRIVGSGDLHDRIDAAIRIEGRAHRVEDSVLEDVLFGVVLHEAQETRVRANRIRSRHADPAERGDAIRLWYSFDNRIEDNDIAQARDIALANSKRNRITGNRVSGGRTALHMIFAGRTLVEGNTFSHNSGGIFALNSEGLVIRRNRILHALSHSGAGIGLKETAAALIQDNDIVHCGVGIMADSPMHPLNRISIVGNRIAHSVTGILFYGESGGHLVHGNRFEHNLTQVARVGFGESAATEWHGNYWDDYQGFDRDGDGVGDTPYELHSYADRIWAGEPGARFFRSSPLLELIDFLERLAPFSLPDLVLRDAAPQAHGRGGP